MSDGRRRSRADAGWTWHEHMHRGTRPIIWLDGLNSPLHRYLGTAAFEPGPAHEIPATIPDTAFVVPSILPENRQRCVRAFAGVPLFPCGGKSAIAPPPVVDSHSARGALRRALGAAATAAFCHRME